jgi:hypothetical protein
LIGDAPGRFEVEVDVTVGAFMGDELGAELGGADGVLETFMIV